MIYKKLVVQAFITVFKAVEEKYSPKPKVQVYPCIYKTFNFIPKE